MGRKKALSEIKALTVAYYDAGEYSWDTWSARWNVIMTSTREKLWSQKLENRVNHFLMLARDSTQPLEFNINILNKTRSELYHFANAYDRYTNPYDANANAYANANVYAIAAGADSVEEAEQVAELARATHRAIATADQKNWIHSDIKPNMQQLKSQLEKTEEFATAVAALKRAEGRTHVRTKPAALAQIKRMVKENLEEEIGVTFINHIDALLTKIKRDLWPAVSISMRGFAATSEEARPALLEHVRGELIDAGFIYPAAALSRYAPVDQAAEAAVIMHAMAQGITIAEGNNWLDPTVKANTLDQRTQLLEIADFLDHVAAYRQRLTIAAGASSVSSAPAGASPSNGARK